MANNNKKVQKKYEKNKKFKKNDKVKEEVKEELKDKLSKCSYDNDSSWYAPNEELLSEVNTFSFDQTIGVRIRSYRHLADASPVAIDYFISAIMEILTFPSIGVVDKPGYTNNYKSAVSAAAQKAYVILSSSNGKTTKYLPEDIGLAILMLGNIIEMVSCYWRLYGTQFMYNPRNRLVPNQLIEAQGFKSADFLKSIANSRARFNEIMARLNGVSMFADIDYFKKCWEMNAHLFYDKNSAMGQIYLMRPAGWFRYADGLYNPTTGYFEGNKCYYEEWTGLIEIDDFLDIIENQVNDMLNSELFNLVYADVQREIARNGGQFYTFGLVPETYFTGLEFSETFMTQVHNMNWGFIDTLAGYEVTDDVANLDLVDNLTPLNMDHTNLAKMSLIGPHLLDFPYTDKPDYKLIADALAYVTGVDYVYTTGTYVDKAVVTALPDHPVYKVFVHTVDPDASVQRREMPGVLNFANCGGYLSAGWLNFDIRPLHRIYDENNVTPTREIGEMNYFTLIEPSKLMNVFEFAFLRLFDPHLRGQ